MAAIPEKDINAFCYVIEEGCEYRLKSNGEQAPPSSSVGDNLSGLATKEELENYATNAELATNLTVSKEYADAKAREVSNKIPSVEGFAKGEEVEEIASNPILKAFDFTRNPSKEDGQAIYLTAEDAATLQGAMQERGLGLYNIWLSKRRND